MVRSVNDVNDMVTRWSGSLRPHGQLAQTERKFARLLLLVLPGSLVLTWLWKQTETSHPFALANAATDAPAAYLYAGTRTFVYTAPPGDEPRCDSQREILRDVGIALGINASAMWQADDCCSWRGVDCNTRGRVEKLDLSKLDLHGTVPSRIGELSTLKTLDLNQNTALSGTVRWLLLLSRCAVPDTRPLCRAPQLPSQLGALGSLRQIYAFGARLSGTLPAGMLELRSLQEVELSDCKLSGTLPPSMAHASRLQYLFLESNRVSGTLPPALASLRRLRELELSHNLLSGSVPYTLSALPLQHLDLQENPRLRGVPVSKPKAGCSGGAEKYLRGRKPATTAAAP